MIDMRIKSMFFDRAAVQSAMDRATLQALSKAGAYIRRSARSSIRKRKKASEPGRPPHSHEGSLRRLLFFGLDRAAQAVVVGPVRFRKGQAPRLLEFGGQVTRRRKTGRARRARYRKRPFMGPALEKNKDQIPGFWRNAIVRS